ncbi:PilZ domain-containing protein [Echinimonas agarilytica]|uniref:PilZ domain-containing protein n=1 Tax=Echinimonas agarilytica TaxID=1215918 RepID=A0AA41W8W9_9GAMM|nr:PilZ domain-containing protein [Echinimonas agarilytica]MCM2681210.1 PilZ domain-containing protein [Echinimonas agarilytica]
MESFTSQAVESRSSDRVSIAKGVIKATLPPPAVWNWFTDISEVAILNFSKSGLGIEAPKPLSDQITIRIKDLNGHSQLVSGAVRHRKRTLTGYYYGVSFDAITPSLSRLIEALTPPKRPSYTSSQVVFQKAI